MYNFWGFLGSSAGKESACNAGDRGSIPGQGRSTGEGKGYPFQYSGLENSVDCIVHWVAKESDMTERLDRTELMALQIPFQQGEEQKANIIMLKLSNH